MSKLFVKWFKEGYWTPDNVSTIGIGMSVGAALTRLQNDNLYNNPTLAGLTQDQSNGNGSIMRILPSIIYNLSLTTPDFLKIVHNTSMITHAHPRSQMGCGIYALFIRELLKTNNIETSLDFTIKLVFEYYSVRSEFMNEIKIYNRILSKDFINLTEKDVRSSGYILHTLEASLWSIFNSRTFKEALLKVVNLGEDTDTVGAVTGGIAGIQYGFQNIPQEWLQKIIRIEDISILINKFISSLNKTK